MPPSDDDQLAGLLFDQSGVITWQQATALLSPGKVRHRLATGHWRRLCRGVLVTFTGPLGLAQQQWVAVLAAGPGAVLAGLAAARAGGLRRIRVRRDDAIDVLLPVQRRPPDLLRRLPLELPAVVVRRTRHLPGADRQLARPTRTVMARSLVDAAQWATTDDEARTVIAAGCQQRLVLPTELLAVLERLPRARHRELIRQTAADAAGGSQTLAEIDLVRLCRRFGLPVPDRQVRRRDASGRLRYLDAYWPRFRLQVEVDGAHHLEVGQWEADMRRQNDLWLQGDRVLRFSSYQVRRRPGEVAEQLRRALGSAGWRP